MLSIEFVNLKDEEILEISPYDNYYDDTNENEMIKVTDILNPEILRKDEDKYKSLHSYVKQYNQRVAKSKIQIPDTFPYSKSNKAEILNLLQEEEPHIAGFKNQLHKISTKKNVKLPSIRRKHNELNYDNIPKDYRKLDLRQNSKKNDQEEKSPLLIINAEEINKYIDLSTTMEDTMESTDENDYDYDALKMDYEQQLRKYENISDKLGYTYEEDKITKKPFEGVISNETKYCTNKDMKFFGIKAIKCLIYNYQHVKDTTEAKETLSKIWLIVKVWLCIYVCIAIPCWCQRGNDLFYIYQIICKRWCCCWFRCKICFPRERIIFVKQYYAQNPPGILIPKLNKKKPIKYEPSEFEQDMHEKLETAIKNI
ncbi:hypothetical protein M0802_008459 [Mischocyttarus mexicanus]|nr:hypothetical protein M0802_008459 [Mischocyttarus mexicanus]